MSPTSNIKSLQQYEIYDASQSEVNPSNNNLTTCTFPATNPGIIVVGNAGTYDFTVVC